ncbi:MAG: hypothetical protein SVU32_02845, partial [Candidatus Nanohaloarchaea archaeon]|nr:hypothetical protein [Candidatus Nanohaloarchaea archaeon]
LGDYGLAGEGQDNPIPPEYWKQIWIWSGGCEQIEGEASGSLDVTPVEISAFGHTLGAGGEIHYDISVEAARYNCDVRPYHDVLWGDGDPTAQLDPYPVMHHNGMGTTYFHDQPLLSRLWDMVVDTYDFTKATKPISYETMSVRMEGVGNNNNWRTRTGKAVYGWNADDHRQQIATVITIVGSVVIEGLVGLATGGIGAIVLAAVAGAAGGAGGEAFLQWYQMQSAWPNH